MVGWSGEPGQLATCFATNQLPTHSTPVCSGYSPLRTTLDPTPPPYSPASLQHKDGVDWVFVDHISYHRPGPSPYGGPGGGAYADNLFRFALLSMAAIEATLLLHVGGYRSGEEKGGGGEELGGNGAGGQGGGGWC